MHRGHKENLLNEEFPGQCTTSFDVVNGDKIPTVRVDF